MSLKANRVCTGEVFREDKRAGLNSRDASEQVCALPHATLDFYKPSLSLLLHSLATSTRRRGDEEGGESPPSFKSLPFCFVLRYFFLKNHLNQIL